MSGEDESRVASRREQMLPGDTIEFVVVVVFITLFTVVSLLLLHVVNKHHITHMHTIHNDNRLVNVRNK